MPLYTLRRGVMRLVAFCPERCGNWRQVGVLCSCASVRSGRFFCVKDTRSRLRPGRSFYALISAGALHFPREDKKTGCGKGAQLKLDKKGYIAVGDRYETNLPAQFARSLLNAFGAQIKQFGMVGAKESAR